MTSTLSATKNTFFQVVSFFVRRHIKLINCEIFRFHQQSVARVQICERLPRVELERGLGSGSKARALMNVNESNSWSYQGPRELEEHAYSL